LHLNEQAATARRHRRCRIFALWNRRRVARL